MQRFSGPISHASTRLLHKIPGLLLCVVALGGVSLADTFFVSDTIDAVPAPEGSLRWAIEQSELNGEPDQILFLIDGGTIALVEPLPTLVESDLVIGSGLPSPEFLTQAEPPSPTGGSAIFVDGGGTIPRAIAIVSASNAITDLEFINFAGDEVILITGSAAQDNVVSRCVFGSSGGLGGNTGAGVRVGPSSLFNSTPSGTSIVLSRFIGNDAGVVFEGTGLSQITGRSLVAFNAFGLDPGSVFGTGTGRPIGASHAGALLVIGNQLAGPGPAGIVLEQGSNNSRVVSNLVGLIRNDSCRGFVGPGIRANATNVAIVENSIACSDQGIVLGPDSIGAMALRNLVGGDAPRGHTGDGILLNGAGNSLIDSNVVFGNEGFGVRSTNISGGQSNDNLLTCNAVFRNASGGLDFPNSIIAPPDLFSATEIAVEGEAINGIPGWVEVFGDDSDQGRQFQGSIRVGDFAPGDFTHRIPVLNLRVANDANGSTIRFTRETPDNHTATTTSDFASETSELSLAIASQTAGLVFDLIRGDTAELAYAATGGTTLGEVVCLDSGLDPDVDVSPNVVDPDLPDAGSAFFYLARRRGALANATGTYDPALCLSYVDAFVGDRQPRSGDCQ